MTGHYEIKVKFWDLGRNKAKGEFVVVGNEWELNNQIEKEFKKHLMSRNVSFEGGTIFAGFHAVGKYKVWEPKGISKDAKARR